MHSASRSRKLWRSGFLGVDKVARTVVVQSYREAGAVTDSGTVSFLATDERVRAREDGLVGVCVDGGKLALAACWVA